MHTSNKSILNSGFRESFPAECFSPIQPGREKCFPSWVTKFLPISSGGLCGMSVLTFYFPLLFKLVPLNFLKASHFLKVTVDLGESS